MKHLDREPTRSVLLTNLPRVSGYQVSHLKAEICEVLTEATSGKVTTIRYSRPKACAVVTFSKRMSVVKALHKGRQGMIFVHGTRVKLFRTPDPVCIQTKEERQPHSKQHNTWQETNTSSLHLHNDHSKIDSYMYLPFHKDPNRPPHISEDICSRIVVPKSQRSSRKRTKFVHCTKVLPKCYSSKKKESCKKTAKQNKKGPKKAIMKNVSTVPRRYTIYVQGLSTLIPVQVKSNDTIAVLKAAIKQKEGIKLPARATLWCKGYKLVDLLTLDDQLVEPESNVTLQMGLPGGSDKDQVTEKALQKLAKNLGAEWERLAIYLDMKKADVDKFKADNPYQTEQQIFAMLVKWKETQGARATRGKLKEKLREAEVDPDKLPPENEDIGAAAKFQDTLANTQQLSQQIPTSGGIPPEKGSEERLVDNLHKLLTEEGKPLSVNELANQFYKKTSLYGKKFKDYGFGPLKAFIEDHPKQFNIRKEKQGSQLVVTPIPQKKKKVKQKKGSQNQQHLHIDENPEETYGQFPKDVLEEVQIAAPASLSPQQQHVQLVTVTASDPDRMPNEKVAHDKNEGSTASIIDSHSIDPKTSLEVSTPKCISGLTDTEENAPDQKIKEQTISIEPQQVPHVSKSKVHAMTESQLLVDNPSLPEKLLDWTTNHVCQWLCGLKLNRDKLANYVEAFKKEDICGKVLPTLVDAGEEGRAAFGVSFGDWAKIVSNIKELQPPVEKHTSSDVSAFASSNDIPLESSNNTATLTQTITSATSVDEIWESVLESVDYFRTSTRAYCLVVNNDNENDFSHIEALADVAWTEVFDFDPNSRESGTFSRCEVPLRDQRSLYITTCRDNAKSLHDKATEWFFPLDDLNVGEREWKKSVGEIIYSHIEKLADFCCRRKPLTVVVMWYGSYKCLPHLNRLLDKMDERITDGVKFVFCIREKPNDETTLQKFNEMCSDLEISDTDIHTIPLATLCQRLKHPENNRHSFKYLLPALNEKVLSEIEVEHKDVAWLAEELDVLYLEQDHSTSFPDEDDLGRDFYHGGTISWYELQLGTYDVERDIQSALENSIKHNINHYKSVIKTLYHAPGAGGTTLARRILWNVHLQKICPCAFVTSLAHDNDAIYKRITWLHNKTSLPVFVVDDSRISKTDLKLIRETFETCRQFTPLVVLDVQRYSSKMDRKREGDKFWLQGEVSQNEALRLTEVFSRKCPGKRDDFKKLVNDAKANRKPHVFEFGLTAFEYEFRGVQSYVSGYLKLDSHLNYLSDLKPWQLVVGFLSLTYYYGQALIPGQFFASILGVGKKDVVDFDHLPFEAKKFIYKEDDNYWRISLHALAKEILEQILCPDSHSRESNVRLSSSATKHLEKFTTMFIKEVSGKERFCPDMVHVIRATFFSRDNKEIFMAGRAKRNLSPLLLDIPSQRPHFTERFHIFKLLAENFPRDPHCLAHLARFCALEREDYQVAKKYIEQALQIREEERQQHFHHVMASSFDEGVETETQYSDRPLSRICNMKGCIYQAEMSSIIGRLGNAETVANTDVNEVISMAVRLAKTASAAFAKCREYYKKGHEDSFGYVPDIKLRLNLIEFIKKNFEDYEAYIGSEIADDYVKDLLCEVDSLIRECNEKVFTLPEEFHTCVDWYYLLYHDDAARAVRNWTNVSSIRGRRGKLAAYRMLNQSPTAKNIWYWDSITNRSDIEDIINLYEQNFEEVFEKGLDYNLDSDMKGWLLAIRHELIENPYTIEEVLLKVRQWYDRGKSPYSIYYMYVLTAVLAIGTKSEPGSRRSLAEMKRLQPLLKRASQSIGKPKLCHEYVASSSSGIKRLGHNQEVRNWDPESRIWKFKGELDWFSGTIRECHSNYKGMIEMDKGRVSDFDSIRVFFVTAASGFWDRRHVNTRVKFLLGFSFEHGPEAFNVTELKRFKCKRCGNNVEMSTTDGIQVIYCKCDFPVTVRKQDEDNS